MQVTRVFSETSLCSKGPPQVWEQLLSSGQPPQVAKGEALMSPEEEHSVLAPESELLSLL